MVTTTEYQAQLPLYSAQDDDDFGVLLYILGGHVIHNNYLQSVVGFYLFRKSKMAAILGV